MKTNATASNLVHRRILILLTSLDMGGAERQALMLARHLLNEQGADVAVWGLGSPGRVSEACAAFGIPWRSFPWPLNPSIRMRTAIRLALAMRRFRPDIVLPYALTPNALAGLFWRLSGARSCIWNQRDAGIGLTRSPVKRLAVKLTPRFVSNTHHGARRLAEQYRLPLSHIEVIPNGVELTPPQASPELWRGRLDVDATTPVVGMVANLTPYKDHATLLRAWRQVVDAYAGEDGTPVLALAGRFGPTYPELVTLAQELGIADTVRFLGAVDDITGLLAVLRVSVLSSRLEGMPNAVLEAMAAGLPVVATDIPSIREIFVGDDVGVHLAPPGDAGALAQSMWVYLRDPGLCASAGAHNRQRVTEAYGPTAMATRMVRIIAQELGIRP